MCYCILYTIAHFVTALPLLVTMMCYSPKFENIHYNVFEVIFMERIPRPEAMMFV